MDHRNGADRPVIRQHHTIAIHDPSSGRLDGPFSLVQIFCFLAIITAAKYHKKNKPSGQP